MMIAPPLPGKTSALDMLVTKTQPREGEASQPLAFEDVLKDEEKKLKQEQEAAALAASVPFQAVTLPTAPEHLAAADAESAPEAGKEAAPVMAAGLAALPQSQALAEQTAATVQLSGPTPQPRSIPAQPADSFSADLIAAQPKREVQTQVIAGQYSVPLTEQDALAGEAQSQSAQQPAVSSDFQPVEADLQAAMLQIERSDVAESKLEIPAADAMSQQVQMPSELKPVDEKPQVAMRQSVPPPAQEVSGAESQSQTVQQIQTSSELKPVDENQQAELTQIAAPKTEVSAAETQSQVVQQMQTSSEFKLVELKSQAAVQQSELTEYAVQKQEAPVAETQPRSLQQAEELPAETKPVQVKKSVVSAQYAAPMVDKAAAPSPLSVAERGPLAAKTADLDPVEAPQAATSSQSVDPSAMLQASQRDNAAAVADSSSVIRSFEPVVQPSEVIEQIMGQMKVRIKSGPGTMRLQLNPQELGAIEVQVVRSAQGISVTFSAEQPGTGRILEAQADQLRQALKDAGVQLNGLNISQQNHQPRQEGGAMRQAPYFGSYSTQDRAAAEKSEVEINRPVRRTGSAGEIDYLI